MEHRPSVLGARMLRLILSHYFQRGLSNGTDLIGLQLPTGQGPSRKLCGAQTGRREDRRQGAPGDDDHRPRGEQSFFPCKARAVPGAGISLESQRI
jgi:hypothetical protein